jgi:hypothetical protein
VEKSSSLEIAAITGFDCQKLLEVKKKNFTTRSTKNTKEEEENRRFSGFCVSSFLRVLRFFVVLFS